VLNEGGLLCGGEGEVLLEGTGRSDYRVVVHIKGLEMKRHSVVILRKHSRGMRLIERILI